MFDGSKRDGLKHSLEQIFEIVFTISVLHIGISLGLAFFTISLTARRLIFGSLHELVVDSAFYAGLRISISEPFLDISRKK